MILLAGTLTAMDWIPALKSEKPYNGKAIPVRLRFKSRVLMSTDPRGEGPEVKHPDYRGKKEPADFTLMTPGGRLKEKGTAGKKIVSRFLPGEKFVFCGNGSIDLFYTGGIFTLEASAARPLFMIYNCPRLYFFVLDDAREIKIRIMGQGTGEHAAIEIYDPSGKKVAESSTRNNSRGWADHTFKVVVPPRHRGKIWSFKMKPAPGKCFEDMSIRLLSGAAPFAAPAPEALVVPPVWSKLTAGEKAVFSLQLHPLIRKMPGAVIKAEFRSFDRKGKNFSKTFPVSTKETIGFEIPFSPLVRGMLCGRVRDRNGKIAAEFQTPVAAAYGQLFNEIIRGDENGAPWSKEDLKRGFRFYRRSEPGDVVNTSKAQKNELISGVKIKGVPGTAVSCFFAVESGKELSVKRSSVVMDGKIPSTLYKLRFWPQRTGYRETEFRIIPELIEKVDSFTLHKGESALFMAKFDIPAGTAAGIYKGKLLFDGKEMLTFNAKVLNVHLPEVSSVFLLSPDSDRWQKFSDDQIRKEMKFFKECGFNALIMHPLYTAVLKRVNGKNVWDISRFRHYMALYKEQGFYHRFVISLAGIEERLNKELKRKKTVYDKAFTDLFEALLFQLRAAGDSDRWPPFLLHTVDEPHFHIRGAAAVRTLKFIKERKFRTFNSGFVKFSNEKLAGILDVRCYCGMGNYESFPTPEITEVRRKECLADGAEMWWYGIGSYDNNEGTIFSNRHGAGAFHFRSGATGLFSWTLLRPRGPSVFDDFDGSWKVKDIAAVYPSADGRELIPTIQWEGLRQGILDWRLLDLLEKKVAASGNKTLHDRFKDILNKVTHFPSGNAQLERMRSEVLNMLEEL